MKKEAGIHQPSPESTTTPIEHNANLMAFTCNDDPWVQSYPCNFLGRRRHEPAIDRLAEIAVTPRLINAPAAASRALQSIGTARSLQDLYEISTSG
ncbi:MAG: hypothetical protein ACLQVD_22430 [Capsulimonadaceae bacterium]